MTGRFQRLEPRLSSTPLILFATVTWAVAAVKGGVNFVAPNVSALSTFPVPEDSLTGTSYGLRTIAWILRIESGLGYQAVAALLVLLTMTIVTLVLRRNLTGDESKVALMLIAAGSLGTVMLGNIGRPDVFVIAGASLLGIAGARGARVAAGGALIMVLGNPEQAALACTGYLMCCLLLPWRPRLRGAVVAAALSASAAIFVALWARAEGVSSRVDYLDDFLGNSIYHFFHHWPLSLYAAYGALWIVVISAFLRCASTRDRAVLAVATIAIPGLVTAVTLDQTRVFVGVSSVVAFALVVACTPYLTTWMRRLGLPPLTATALACLLLPSLEVTYSGTLRLAYEWVFAMVG